MRKINYKSGYSLVEIIVYVSILAMLSVVVVNSFIVVLNSFKTTKINRSVLESGFSTMERLSREIKQANTIVDVNSVFGSNPGILEIKNTNFNNVVTTYTFKLNNEVLELYENGSLIGPLNNTNTKVTFLVFKKIDTLKGKAVKIEMTIKDTKEIKTESFYNTIILRESY